MEGIAGQAFGDLGLAVVVSLIASFLVAIFFIPMLASRTGVNFENLTDRKYPWLRFKSVEHFRRDFKPSILPILLLPYFLVRFTIGMVLELLW